GEPSTNLPDGSMIPAFSSSATVSTRPEPQMPTASTSPITVSSMSPSSRSLTPSIAPSAARMPRRMLAASNAGPAGAAQASARAAGPSPNPGGRSAGGRARGRAEHDLGVRADVDEQAHPLVERQARREHARDDVGTDVG